MKTFASEHSTVAWFKLADFIARGEKERALHMYPLLMHSVSDPAISLQLEGDILRAFDDVAAFERYHQAVVLYKKAGKIKQAISLYEHLISVKDEELVFKELLNLYILSGNSRGFIQVFTKLSKFYVDRGHESILIELVEVSKNNIPQKFFVIMYAYFLRALLIYKVTLDGIEKKVESCLELFMELLEENHNLEKEFQKFISDLKFLNFELFEKIEHKLY